MKYSTDKKMLDILGFTDLDNTPAWMMMDDQAHYVLPDDNVSFACFSLVFVFNQISFYVIT